MVSQHSKSCRLRISPGQSLFLMALGPPEDWSIQRTDDDDSGDDDDEDDSDDDEAFKTIRKSLAESN